MKNKKIGEYEAVEIQGIVKKILKGLGNPEPPLDLRDARDLLDLDRQYYSSSDLSTAGEVVSKLKIAGKQIVKRPTLLSDVLKKIDLSALWLPDRKRILIDSDKPLLKHRWAEAHEIGHSLPPWHKGFLFGDHDETLILSCQEILENEANYIAGNLIFMQERFTSEAFDYEMSLKSVRSLSKTFGNTKTCTLWRYVEEAHKDLPIVGLVSQNPKFIDDDFDPNNPCKYCVESPVFKQRFSNVTEINLFNILSSYCLPKRGGPLGETSTSLYDDNDERHLFYFESWSNTYDVLTLGVYQKAAASSF